jgi:hypothetical protein
MTLSDTAVNCPALSSKRGAGASLLFPRRQLLARLALLFLAVGSFLPLAPINPFYPSQPRLFFIPLEATDLRKCIQPFGNSY